jgi:OPA family glycerol-3-phosphate transporter-like MFS transporter
MLTEAKHIRFLSILCFMVYFTSYVTRINFGAIVAEVVLAEGFLKSSVSFVITAGFISYGIGQLISGVVGDKVNPKKIIFWGLISTSVLNFIMPFCKSIALMTIIWTLNGFAQSTMWPPLVKVMTHYFSNDDFKKNCVTVSIAASLGTVFVYLFAPVVIYFSSWEMVLVISSGIAFIVAFVWISNMKKIENYSQINENQSEEAVPENSSKAYISPKQLFVSSGLVFIIIGVISQGIVKDSVTTWMPSYIAETFFIGSSLSILSAVALPIFSIFSVKIAAYLQKNIFKNELTCSTVIFFAALISTLAMAAFSSQSVWLSVALASIITGSMHGVNLCLISLIPAQFSRFGNVSSVSGMLNFCAYIGSALSMYGIAKLSEAFGWHATLLAWAFITFIGTSACFVCIKRWHRFTKELD